MVERISSDTAVWARAARVLAGRDPVLAQLRDRFRLPDLGPATENPLASLVRAVTQQQIAAPAARAIYARLLDALGGTVTAEALAASDEGFLRGAGLSANKAATLKGLAHGVLTGDLHLDLADLAGLDDSTITAQLTSVRGIGAWTAEMFLMFQLHRTDVWPAGDLVVRKGIAAAWRLPLPTPKAAMSFGDAFRPYRSVAAWYCYRAAREAINPEVPVPPSRSAK